VNFECYLTYYHLYSSEVSSGDTLSYVVSESILLKTLDFSGEVQEA